MQSTSRPLTSAERTLLVLAASAGFGNLHALARASRIDRHQFGLWLRHGVTPRPVKLQRVAETLGVPPEMLDRLFSKARAEKETRGAA